MKKTVLQVLLEHKGEYVSGEEISDLLQVSRTAVWKHIRGLKEAGYKITSSPGKGYCLLERPDLLIPMEIKTGLQTEFLGQKLLCYSTLDSTNEAAKREALAGAPEGTIVVAEQQEQGRGRLERNWFSPPELGLWFSVILRPKIDLAQASQLTFVSAVAVCKALRTVTGLPLMIKWPNDLLYKGKKLCGILTELGAEIEEINYLVIGIGLNVNQQEKDFPPEIRKTASSLALATGRSWQRAELLRQILEEYEKQYEIYLTKGFEQTLLFWRELNVTLGKEVMVSTREESFTGIAEDINEDGCLLVRRDSGELEILIAGDVSLRGSFPSRD
ncbi:MAG: biotin--[acetyl-CoA-carboxylase] ligase [Peptococcia bacterium]|jgi:BirA family biotin operon repressor/biotin-[acetyl-CoA-carboxylase] ligase